MLGLCLGPLPIALAQPFRRSQSKGGNRIKGFRSPSGREPPFFARAKKRGPKKARPAYAPSPLRGLGPLRRRDFSTRHPCLVEKRRASMRVALRVFPVGSVAAEGDPEVKSKSTSTGTSTSNSQGQGQSQSQSQSLHLVTLNGGAAARAASSRLPRRAPRQKRKRRPRRRRPGSREKPDQNFGSNSAAWPVLTITFCSASHTFRLPATTCWVSGPLSSMRARVAPR